MHLTRNQAYLPGYRGFKSLSLRQTNLTRTQLLLSGHGATHDSRSGSAAAVFPVAQKPLDSFPGVDFRGINVALAVQAHLVQPVEFSRHPAAAPEPAQLLQVGSVQDI